MVRRCGWLIDVLKIGLENMYIITGVRNSNFTFGKKTITMLYDKINKRLNVEKFLTHAAGTTYIGRETVIRSNRHSKWFIFRQKRLIIVI